MKLISIILIIAVLLLIVSFLIETTIKIQVLSNYKMVPTKVERKLTPYDKLKLEADSLRGIPQVAK
jgi:cell division protein FtsL